MFSKAHRSIEFHPGEVVQRLACQNFREGGRWLLYGVVLCLAMCQILTKLTPSNWSSRYRMKTYGLDNYRTQTGESAFSFQVKGSKLFRRLSLFCCFHAAGG